MGVDFVTIDPRHARLMTPGGTRDFLPADAARKLALERALQETFRLWGYAQVITPTAEFLETLVQSNGQETAEQMYRLFDREGHTLALRPELTTPIARIAATRLKHARTPIRLHYVANVFRHETLKAGRQREFWQAGVELIGAAGAAADAEVIALAVRSLQASRLRTFRVEIGHVGYFNGLLNSLSLASEQRRELRRALLRRDYVGYEAALDAVRDGADGAGGGDAKAESAWASLRGLPRLRGGADVIEGALAAADNDESRAAAADIAAIYEQLQAHGVAEFVQVDFGMIKDLDYYTGMVLEGYADGIGFPVCTGGRYDNLIGRFGEDRPATGFVLGVERVLAGLAAQGVDAGEEEAGVRPHRLVAYEPRHRDTALAGARKLREQGLIVEVDVTGLDVDGSREYARARGIPEVVFIGDDTRAVRLRAPKYEQEEVAEWP